MIPPNITGFKTNISMRIVPWQNFNIFIITTGFSSLRRLFITQMAHFTYSITVKCWYYPIILYLESLNKATNRTELQFTVEFINIHSIVSELNEILCGFCSIEFYNALPQKQ